ncbi:hypothetical protein NDU88_004351 [Pleurodeles waltl]|uniref:Uncharacterized protein n=1 Tax=Pleurodeles waltl TaxID=8319 RepID=A0AAV7UFW7_PLEWA|nr:hypothetical protein NDU88_004351 [Pleurodeles waltl]
MTVTCILFEESKSECMDMGLLLPAACVIALPGFGLAVKAILQRPGLMDEVRQKMRLVHGDLFVLRFCLDSCSLAAAPSKNHTRDQSGGTFVGTEKNAFHVARSLRARRGNVGLSANERNPRGDAGRFL